MAVMTRARYEESLRSPAFCELLPIRDFLDGVMIRANGAYVAGYELGGLHSYLPVRSMQKLHRALLCGPVSCCANKLWSPAQ